MGNLNSDDKYLQRLGKLVPVYVLAIISIANPLLGGLDPIFKLGALVLVWFLSFAGIYFFEVFKENVTNKGQIALAAASTILYLILLTIGQIELDDRTALQLSALLTIVVGSWTIIVPEISKKIA